jgi:methylenetetrahydrofolate reductase (NADPH)
MGRMRDAVHPLFSDITWGAGGSTAGLSLELAKHMQQTGHTANLHLTCTNITGSDGSKSAGQVLKETLAAAAAASIENIVALRGDPPAGETEWKSTDADFTCALDLVRFIRSEFGPRAFGIAVAGYPEGHPNAISEIADPATLTPSERARSSTHNGITYACLDADYGSELDYLKEKVDAGAGGFYTLFFCCCRLLLLGSFIA